MAAAKLDGFKAAAEGKAAQVPVKAIIGPDGTSIGFSLSLPVRYDAPAAEWTAAGAVFGTGSAGVRCVVVGGPLDGQAFNLMGPSSGIKKADRLKAENDALRARLAALEAAPRPDSDGVTRVAAGPGKKAKR